MNGRSSSEHRTMNDSGHNTKQQRVSHRRFHRREMIRSRSLKNSIPTTISSPQLPSRSRSLNNRLARHQLETEGWNDTFGINVFDLDPNDNSSHHDHSSNADLDFGADWQDNDDNAMKDSSSKEDFILNHESLSSHVRRGLSQRNDALRRTSSPKNMDQSGHKNTDESTRRRRRTTGRRDRSSMDSSKHKNIDMDDSTRRTRRSAGRSCKDKSSDSSGEIKKRSSLSQRRKEDLRRSSSTSRKVERTEMKQ